jgi:hypothetical protein
VHPRKLNLPHRLIRLAHRARKVRRLVFENPKGEPDPQSARDLSALLKEHAVPAVVLNACQAAMLDANAEDAFASVATALLQSGMRSVVAMVYSLYVSGALPAGPARLSLRSEPRPPW